MDYLFYLFFQRLNELFGIRIASKIEDTLIYFCGLFFGSLLTLLLGAYYILNIRFMKMDDDISILRINYKGKDVILTNPKNLFESAETIVRFIFFKVFNNSKPTVLRNDKRSKCIVFIIVLIAIFFGMLAYYMINNVIGTGVPNS